MTLNDNFLVFLVPRSSARIGMKAEENFLLRGRQGTPTSIIVELSNFGKNHSILDPPFFFSPGRRRRRRRRRRPSHPLLPLDSKSTQHDPPEGREERKGEATPPADRPRPRRPRTNRPHPHPPWSYARVPTYYASIAQQGFGRRRRRRGFYVVVGWNFFPPPPPEPCIKA